MGGRPVRPYVENWLRDNPNRTVSLVEISSALDLAEGSVQDVMRRLANETESGVTVVHRGHAWRYDPNAVVPPEASEALAQVDKELEAEPVKRTRPAKERPTAARRVPAQPEPPEAKEGNGFLDFQQVGWSRVAKGGLFGSVRPLIRGSDGVIYRGEPV